MFVKTSMDAVATDREIFPFQNVGPRFVTVFLNMLIYRFWFAHSLLRPEIEVLSNMLSPSCPPTHLYHLPLMAPDS